MNDKIIIIQIHIINNEMYKGKLNEQEKMYGPVLRTCSAPACRLRVLSLCLCVCFVLHLVSMLNCGEFLNPIDSRSSSE